MTRTAEPSTTLHAAGATVDVVCHDGRLARLHLRTEPAGRGVQEGARLTGTAVAHARDRGAVEVQTVLDGSRPTCGAVLGHLQGMVGSVVGRMSTRRAGSSVLVHLTLLPERRA